MNLLFPLQNSKKAKKWKYCILLSATLVNKPQILLDGHQGNDYISFFLHSYLHLPKPVQLFPLFFSCQALNFRYAVKYQRQENFTNYYNENFTKAQVKENQENCRTLFADVAADKLLLIHRTI